MKKKDRVDLYSTYDYVEQDYVYTLCEERRDWRKHIEEHITEAKEEIMGDSMMSITESTKEIKAEVKENNALLRAIKNIIDGFSNWFDRH